MKRLSVVGEGEEVGLPSLEEAREIFKAVAEEHTIPELLDGFDAVVKAIDALKEHPEAAQIVGKLVDAARPFMAMGPQIFANLM